VRGVSETQKVCS